MPAHDIRWTAIFSFVLASHRDLPSLSHVRDWTAMDCNRKSWTLPFTISSTFSCTSAWKCLPKKQVPSKSQAASLYILYAHSQLFTIIHNSEFVCYKTARSSEVGSGFCSRDRSSVEIPGWRFGGFLQTPRWKCVDPKSERTSWSSACNSPARFWRIARSDPTKQRCNMIQPRSEPQLWQSISGALGKPSAKVMKRRNQNTPESTPQSAALR